MRYLTRILMAMIFIVAMTGCASSGSDSAADLEALEQQLAQVTAERDALAAQSEAETGRRDLARKIMDEIVAILDDHEAYGTEAEVADLIASHASETAVMDDDVFGPYPYREAFFNTLYFGGADAHIDVYASWLSDDGTQGGFLWMWNGTNPNRYPFELAGISLVEFAEDGRVAHERVTYPYPDEYVYEAWMGGGTEILSTGQTPPDAAEFPPPWGDDPQCHSSTDATGRWGGDGASGPITKSSQTGRNAARRVPSSMLPSTRRNPPGSESQNTSTSIWYSAPDSPETAAICCSPMRATNTS